MKQIVNRDGHIAEHYGETEEIPERYVQTDRDRARRELAKTLGRSTQTSASRAEEIAERVVPQPGPAMREAEARSRVAQAQREQLRAPERLARLAAANDRRAQEKAERLAALVARLDERRAKARAQGSGDGMEATA